MCICLVHQYCGYNSLLLLKNYLTLKLLLRVFFGGGGFFFLVPRVSKFRANGFLQRCLTQI